jgi:MrfA Zn-binding domain
VKPVSFSVKIDNGTAEVGRYRKTTLVRQRQSLTHFIDFVEPDALQASGVFRIAVKDRGKLFRYNLGPANKGFVLCDKCGYSAPLNTYSVGKKHHRVRGFSGPSLCANAPWTKPLAFGHEFETFCLIARPMIPVAQVESLAYALQRGLCRVLDIETSDIGVSWRWLATRSDKAGVEVILYDRTPGGAGFAQEGFANWPTVVAKAYEICHMCTCEAACFECLKDYGNQTHHEQLDRQWAADFLKT